MQLQGDAVGRGDLAGGVGDLVFGALVFEGEFAAGGRRGVSTKLKRGGGNGGTNRLGSMLFPAALLISFLLATGPMLVRWSALGEVMMESQMMALLVALVVEAESGHSAVT